MKQGYSSEADGGSSSRGIPHNLWNPKGHYYVHRNPLLHPILSQMNVV